MNLRIYIALAALHCLMALGGCARSESAKEKFDLEKLSGYGDLPLLRTTHHGTLKNELARLEAEGATPALLVRRKPPQGDAAASAAPVSVSPPMRAAVADNENVAVALDRIFARKLLTPIAERCDELFPEDEFKFDAIELEQIAEFRQRYEPPHNDIRAALALPACDFGYDHTAGLAADLWFLDAVRIAVRLEAFAAANAFAADRPGEAVVALGNMLRLCSFLAQERCAAARVAAAQLRIDTLRVLEAAAQHRAADAALHRRLHELLIGCLAEWTDDADAWIGDRALGLHTYELVRDGYVLSLLDEDELARLRDARQLLAFSAAVGKEVDRDELFYLETMRSIVESCRRPYHERKTVFLQLRDRLDRLEDDKGAPLVAENILLAHIEQGHVMQARDRSLCEGWALVLAAACGETLPDFQNSPLTGKPYELVRQQTRVVLRGAGQSGLDRPLIAPITSEPPARQARAARGGLSD